MKPKPISDKKWEEFDEQAKEMLMKGDTSGNFLQWLESLTLIPEFKNDPRILGAILAEIEENGEHDSHVKFTPDSPLEKAVSKLQTIKKSRSKMEKEKIVIFYGFTGKMKYQYSVVECNKAELQARMATVSNMIDIPWSIKTEKDWQEIMKDSDTTTKFELISFEDAMSIIRNGDYGEKKEELVPFIEAEEEEFTDNCTAECSPGDHRCGKK